MNIMIYIKIKDKFFEVFNFKEFKYSFKTNYFYVFLTKYRRKFYFIISLFYTNPFIISRIIHISLIALKLKIKEHFL